MSYKKEIGNKGECIAREFLTKKGLKFVSANYHGKSGEIDLIFYDSKYDEYVFVEVKTRTSTSFGYGEEAITPSKIENILSAGEDFFLQKLNQEEVPFFRIDAVIVDMSSSQAKCEHIENIGIEE